MYSSKTHVQTNEKQGKHFNFTQAIFLQQCQITQKPFNWLLLNSATVPQWSTKQFEIKVPMQKELQNVAD
jgi:hypothetical protein